ncbi:MAG TPA: hypothetical protein DGU45_08535 [Planctomycetes bacterium]|nr:hypothetical protein [Planctomycetota bacterium]
MRVKSLVERAITEQFLSDSPPPLSGVESNARFQRPVSQRSSVNGTQKNTTGSSSCPIGLGGGLSGLSLYG